MDKKVITLNEERKVTLTVYLLDVGGKFGAITKRPLVLVLPGGAYQYCSDREADPVAFSYLKAGYHAAVLRYSVAEHAEWPNPLADYEQTMELLREKAREWNIYADRIAVIGFSAGGHLAAAAATMAKNRPAAAILGYAVTSADVRVCSPMAPDTVREVDGKTPPCFLFHTRNDNVVPVMNSIRFMEALAENDITFESHIYSYGPHGFSTCDTSVQDPFVPISRRVPDWVEDSIGWLREVLGEFDSREKGLLEPEVRAHISADGEPFLSVDCTLGHIQSNPAGAGILEEFMDKGDGAADSLREVPPEIESTLKRMILRDIMNHTGTESAEMEELDARLRQIPNT